MVLFLFVIMLLGADRVETNVSLPWQAPVAVAITLLLFGLMMLALLSGVPGMTDGVPVGEVFGSPQAVGEILFRDFLLPFEATSILLLAAMVGAIVLTRRNRQREAS
jgi:NADH-quinone oxidoreductase subunit J